ncbi:MAG: site-specific integrase [Chloroflexi bacterium]|nr:site-specific integrase [Chloroflexota bacterium]
MARRQEFHAGFKTKRAAEEALARALAELSLGTYVEPRKLLFSDYLLKEWLPAIRSTVRLTTYLSYEGHVRRHVVPELGCVPLQKLSPAHLNAFYAKLAQPGKGRALSPASVRRVHATLHRSLRDAVRWSLLARSPADGADPPRPGSSPEMKVWQAEEVKRFLLSQEETREYPLWLLFATTGMRRGEALGLLWKDLDLTSGRLSVTRTRVLAGCEVIASAPKTQRGRRLIILDPVTAATLRKYHSLREDEARERGEELPDTDCVFAHASGRPYHPERVSRLFKRLVKEAGLPRIRLHDLRHSYATVALAAQVHPRVVSERLGHASTAITMDVYSHCLPALAEEAAGRVAALVLPG